MSKQDEVCWPCERWPEILTLQTRAAHTCGAEMGTAAESGGQTAVRGAGESHGAIWAAGAVQTFDEFIEAVINDPSEALVAEVLLAMPDLCASHEALRADRAALTARLAEAEAERDAARSALDSLVCYVCRGKGSIAHHCWGSRWCAICQGTGKLPAAQAALRGLPESPDGR